MVDNFKWSQESYFLTELVEIFEHKFPLIVKVTGGYHGDSDHETMSRSEVLRLHCWDKHQRIVAKDSNGRRYYSIPALHPLNFTVTKDEKTLASAPLKELVDKFPKPFSISPADDSGQFTSSSEPKKVFKLKNLIVEDEYEERFVKANGISNGVLNVATSVIPCYIKATMAVAEGLHNRLPGQWLIYMDDVSKLVEHISYDEYQPNQDIMLYSAGMVEEANSVYASIEPSLYLSLTRPNREERQIYDEIKPTLPKRKISMSEKGAAGYATIVNSDPPSHKPADRKPLALGVVTPHGNVQKELNRLLTKGPVKLEGKKSVPHEPSKSAKSSMANKDKVHSLRLGKTSDGVAALALKPARLPRPDRRYSAGSMMTSKPTASVIPSSFSMESTPENAQRTGGTIHSLRDVPNDITSLTIIQIADCLSLLKLEKYREAFVESQVDGKLLVTLDETILREDFNMGRLNARKLIAFANEEYRAL